MQAAETTTGSYTDEQGVKYTLNENGTCGVTGITQDIKEEIVIPEKITVDGNEYDVTNITNEAFRGSRKVISISIPESVTEIGARAFEKCSSLSSISIPESVTEIGACAFVNCSSLSSVSIPKSVTTIGNYVFRGCSSLTDIIVDESNPSYMSTDGILYTKSGEQLICCPGGKAEVNNYPEGIKSISAYAFSGCNNVTSISILDGVTKIGEQAFSECGSLIDVYIPESVTEIAAYSWYLFVYSYNIFEDCSSLKSINVDENNKHYTSVDGVLYRKAVSGEALICCPGAKEEINAYPEAISEIAPTAFYGCRNLTKVNIPDSVESVGCAAFYGCSSLTSANISDSITDISAYMFADCNSLISVNIPDGITSIGVHAFAGCSKIEHINIPDSVTKIGEGAFSNCSSLTSVKYQTILQKLVVLYL